MTDYTRDMAIEMTERFINKGYDKQTAIKMSACHHKVDSVELSKAMARMERAGDMMEAE